MTESLLTDLTTDQLFLPPPSPEKQAITNEIVEIVKHAVEKLTSMEQDIVSRYHGLNGHNPETFLEIGKHHDFSMTRANQLYARALRKLRHPHFRKGLDRAYEDSQP